MIFALLVLATLFIVAAIILILGILITGFAWLIIPLGIDILMTTLFIKLLFKKKDKK